MPPPIASNSILSAPWWVPTSRNRREKRALAKLDAVFEALIRTRRASTENRNDLLSTLLAAVDVDSVARACPTSNSAMR